MKILAIESSCDETSAAVVEKKGDKIIVRSNITATSLAMHAKTGGIIPENAAREQVKYIMPVIAKALNKSRGKKYKSWKNAKDILENDIDAIAVTYGPGLIGSLLVGVETAKTLSFVFNKPLIPTNHLLAHLFANFISKNGKQKEIVYPFIGLIVSGGHTDLLYFKSVKDYKWLGGTRDDAAGEALDKIGRLLVLSYPAGAEIEKIAKLGKDTKIRFHAPMLRDTSFDFSFSGLKTEVARFVKNKKFSSQEINGICFAVQKAVLDVLVRKTIHAAEKYKVKTILLGGGVSANKTLFKQFTVHGSQFTVYAPEKKYATDNAAMIGAYALLNPQKKSWEYLYAQPDLYFS